MESKKPSKKEKRARVTGDVMLSASGDELTAGIGQDPLALNEKEFDKSMKAKKNVKASEEEIAEYQEVVDSHMGIDDLSYASSENKVKRLITKRKLFTLPQWALAWIVLIPALIFLVFFMFYPIINTFSMAFIQDFRWVAGSGSFAVGNFINAVVNDGCIKYNALGECATALPTIPSVGFGNFATVLGDKVFLDSIVNTAILVIVEVPLTILIALLIASCLNSIKSLRGLYQTVFFLPYVTNAIALGLIFNMLFASGSGGLINMFLNLFGVDPINWLNYSDPSGPASKFTQGVVIVIYAIWNGLAFKILIFMSGLATIDKQYYDAAKVDGTSNVTIWRRITLPLLSPQLLYITITSFIGAFKMYTGVRAVYVNSSLWYFGGAKGEDWMPVVGWIYRALKQDSYLEPGIAASGSLVLLCIILVITALQFAASKKRVHY